MRLSEYALGELKNFISGDCGFTPNLSGPKLIELFNSFGDNDEYYSGFPSRNKYVFDKLNSL